MTSVEMAQLRIRLIAVENLVIALLSDASDRQLELARAMASHLAEANGPYPLVIHAAAQMNDLITRAGP
jgi:hypothetical protein